MYAKVYVPNVPYMYGIMTSHRHSVQSMSGGGGGGGGGGSGLIPGPMDEAWVVGYPVDTAAETYQKTYGWC